jgi:hypothetical protein
MKTAICTLKSISPYTQSRYHDTPKENREGADVYELRTWREKAHYLPDTGEIFIPAMALKQSLDAAAKFQSIQIPGKGKSTYTKHFVSGVLPDHRPIVIGHNKDEIEPKWILANADGVRGSGKRVKRAFPLIPEWEATARFFVVDDTITKDVFEEHLKASGQFIGIGQFRPQNGGFNGRFIVEAVRWE